MTQDTSSGTERPRRRNASPWRDGANLLKLLHDVGPYRDFGDMQVPDDVSPNSALQRSADERCRTVARTASHGISNSRLRCGIRDRPNCDACYRPTAELLLFLLAAGNKIPRSVGLAGAAHHLAHRAIRVAHQIWRDRPGRPRLWR